MLTTNNTKDRILKAIENGAQIVMYCYLEGTWSDGYVGVSKVTLERNGYELNLSTRYREDEWYYVPCDEDGKCWLRHGSESMPESADKLARELINDGVVRQEYAGYRSDYARSWQQVYSSHNAPVPRWVSEQWDSPDDFRPLEVTS